MAITSAGYDGTVDEVQMAGMAPKTGTSEYGVEGAGDFAVSAVAGQDRTVSIAPGTAWGHFVKDVSDANITKALTAPSSGSRWDMIVLSRDWQPAGGTTVGKVIEGGSSSNTLPSRLTNPGVTDDQPLALVRVDAGSTTIGDIIDLRCWGRNGGLTAKNTRVLQYLTAIGSAVEINGTTWQRLLDANNTPVWAKTTRHEDTGWTDGFAANGWTGTVKVRRVGNQAEVKVTVRRDGATIDVPSNGNLVNTQVAKVNSSFAPSIEQTGLSSGGSGRLAAGTIYSGTGEIYLTAVPPNDDIANGDPISLYGKYFTD
jgi:hypothetical protein